MLPKSDSNGAPRSALILTYNEFPSYDGLAVRVHNLVIQLVNRGFCVTIIAPRYGESRAPHPWDQGQPYDLIVLKCPVPISLGKIPVLGRFLKNLRFMFKTAFFLLKARKTLKPEVVQAEEFNAVIPAILAKWVTGAPLIVDDVTLMEQVVAGRGSLAIGKLVGFIEKLAYRFVDRFVCASREGVDYLQGRVKNPSTYLLPNGVDADSFNPGDSRQIVPGRLFFNCSLTNFQNIDAIRNALNILPIVRAKVPEAHLTLICSPKERMPVDLGRQISETPGVTLLAGVPDLVPHIQQASIALMPYTPGQGTLGGGKLKLMEYLACGRVVIATPGSLDGFDGLTPGKELIVVEDLESLASRVIEVLRDPDSFTGMRHQARSFVVKRCSWASLVTDEYVRFVFDQE